jgi:prophage regulatory protein
MVSNTSSYTELPVTGFIRLNQVLQLIPISRASWFAGVRSGQYPQGYSLGPRTTAYKVEDIRTLIESLSKVGKP